MSIKSKREPSKVDLRIGPISLFTIMRMLDNHTQSPHKKADAWILKYWDRFNGGLSHEGTVKLQERLMKLAEDMPEFDD